MDFHKSLGIKFYGNPPSRSRADTRRRTDGHDETVDYYVCAKAPKNTTAKIAV